MLRVDYKTAGIWIGNILTVALIIALVIDYMHVTEVEAKYKNCIEYKQEKLCTSCPWAIPQDELGYCQKYFNRTIAGMSYTGQFVFVEEKYNLNLTEELKR